MYKSISFALSFIFSISVVYAAPENTSTLNDQQEVAVTIYNENLALIKDTRKVSLASGEDRLAWRDV